MDGAGPMTTGQMLLACICLAGYSVALGRLVGPFGRVLAISLSAIAAAAFVTLSASWEAGFIMVAFLPVGFAILAAATWALWRLIEARARVVAADEPASPQLTLRPAESSPARAGAPARAFF
jgi:hypothetical protein